MDRRKKRTSINQYVMYIDLLENDSIFLSGTVPRGVDSNYLSKKWKELSDKLNTCANGPVLTPDEWKKRLNDWKNSTRCKYRRSVSCEKDITMSPLEMKALRLFGKTTTVVKSDSGNIQLKSEEVEDFAITNGDGEESNSCRQNKIKSSTEDIQRDLDAAIRTATEENEDKNEESPNEVNALEINANFETIVVDSDTYNEVKLISEINRESSGKLITGDIPIKRCRMPEAIIYEVKKSSTADEEKILDDKIPSNLDTHEIAYQLKRIADIKEEKLKFEIARFKFNNPGFNFSFNFS